MTRHRRRSAGRFPDGKMKRTLKVSRVRMRRIGLALIAFCITSCTSPLPSQTQPVSAEHVPATACDSDLPANTVRANVPGHPFEALASPDGCWIFVSLISSSTHPLIGNRGGGIGVLRWTGSQLALERVVPLSPPRPTGMVLSNGQALLLTDYDSDQIELIPGLTARMGRATAPPDAPDSLSVLPAADELRTTNPFAVPHSRAPHRVTW